MRRGAIAGLLLVVVLSACSSNDRPEGVVERWLLSLNQGVAGTPDRYGGQAAVEAANTIVPDWRARDPGSFDRIEVDGNPAWAKGMIPPMQPLREVPFRIETTDGRVIQGVVDVTPCGSGSAPGARWCVVNAGLGGVTLQVGSTWSTGVDPAGWAWALGTAVVLTLLAVGLVLAVRRTAATNAAS
jgi:hypothetical protein